MDSLASPPPFVDGFALAPLCSLITSRKACQNTVYHDQLSLYGKCPLLSHLPPLRHRYQTKFTDLTILILRLHVRRQSTVTDNHIFYLITLRPMAMHTQ